MSLTLRNNWFADPFFEDDFESVRFPSFRLAHRTRSPFSLMRHFEDDNWFDSNWPAAEMSSAGACDVKETDDEFQVALDAPGFQRDEIHVDIQDNVLTISGEKKHEHSKDDGKFQRREFRSQSFSRSFTLPADKVDTEKIVARFDGDGILRLTVPKLPEIEQKQQVKSIPIE